MTAKNLWGELPARATFVTPAAILKQQAAIFNQRYEGRLLAHVLSMTTTGSFIHSLAITAPTFQNYRIEVLSMRHKLNPYPLEMLDSIKGETTRCANQAAFEKALETTLTSDHLRKTISALIAQIDDAA